jgi:hypothetical protein
MAIDMIEQSEMSALSTSRLGNKCFVNDTRDESYSNFSFRGHKYFEKKRSQQDASTVNTDWAIDPTKENDCTYLQDRLGELQNQIEVELSSNPSKARVQNVIGALKRAEANFKNKIASLKCVETKASAELEKTKQDTLAEINKASATTPDLNQPIADASGGSKTTKYLMYGIGGVVVVVTLIIVIKAMRK